MMKDLHQNRRLDCQQVFHLDGKGLSDFRKSWKKAVRKSEGLDFFFMILEEAGSGT